MPFTFSHPVAVLPLKKWSTKYFDLTALILGSMAPDFEYFLHFKPWGIVGHTGAGCFYYNFPLVFLVAYIWHKLVKKEFLQHLPYPFDCGGDSTNYKKWGINSFREFIIFFYSALLGMATHIFWDAFTHQKGYFVQKIPLLMKVVKTPYIDIPVYKFAQHGSTLLGLGIIVFYIYLLILRRNKRNSVNKKVQKIRYWLGILLVATGIMISKCIIVQKSIFHIAYGELIVSTISSMILAITLISGLYQILNKKIFYNY